MPWSDIEVRRAYGRMHYAKNSTKLLARQRARKLANPERYREIQHRHLAKKDYRLRLFQLRRNAALRAGIEFDVKFEDLVWPTHCPVLGINLKYEWRFRKISGPAIDSPSLDRHDNSKGYITGNVRIISARANSLKKDATIEEIELILRYMRDE